VAEELSKHEQFLRRVESLAISALPIPDGFLAAAPKHQDGVMVALVPENPEDFAVDHEEALPAEDLHITLCYLGKIDEFTNTQKSRIIQTAHRICDTAGQEFSAKADGVVVMGKDDRGIPATAYLIQSEEIVDLYEAMAGALDYQSKYPSFIPHMTAGYGIPVEDVQDSLGKPIRFTNVIVKFGNDRHTIPLSSALVAAPRGANIIDRVIDSLGRMWDEALHPRGNDGRFIKKNGAVTGKLAVPTRDRKGVEMVDVNRASVVGFHTFDNEVWVLAEVKNPDGSTTQGFAKASQVVAVAPVKARLDALYPITEDDAFITSSMERKRQLDLLLSHITDTYGPNNDTEGANAFLDSLGLWEQDNNYINDGDDPNFLGGIRRVDQDLTPDEIDEQQDIIEDARQVKALRDRVHGLQEDLEPPVSDNIISREEFDHLAEVGLASNKRGPETDAFFEAAGGEERILDYIPAAFGKRFSQLSDDERNEALDILYRNAHKGDPAILNDLMHYATQSGNNQRAGEMHARLLRAEREELDKIPVPEGHIRLFRGETAADGPTRIAHEADVQGQWWTANLEIADSYARTRILRSGKVDQITDWRPEGAAVRWVDVPEDLPRRIDQGGAGVEYQIPGEFREKAGFTTDLGTIGTPKTDSDTPGSIKSVADLMDKYDKLGVDSFVSERDGSINLSKVVVGDKSQGTGTAFMQDLTDYADSVGKRIDLTPSSDFGGSKPRLIEFYKRHGFVENKGRNKDYEVSETMYRLPETLETPDEPDVPDLEPHVVPTQKLLNSDGPEPEVVEALRSGADPFSLDTPNLLAAMDEAGRFEEPTQIGAVGVSTIGWRVDTNDQTGTDVRLAGTGQSTTGRAYFVKESVIGADMHNTDIVKEVLSSLIAEQIADTVGPDDPRQIPIPKSVFGDNPVWDGQPPVDNGPFDTETHQPAHVVSSHADYVVPADWEKTTIADEEAALHNDLKSLGDVVGADVQAGYYEDMGDIYGNDIARLVMWDFLILNGDRNFGNAILAASDNGDEGRVLPIDHGFAFDESPLEDEGASIDEVFAWFMNYPYTQSWMNYVHGGLDLETTVTPDTIRQTLEDFTDVYSQISVEEILSRFRAMPNVTDAQIAVVEKALSGVVDRAAWMRDNVEMILKRLTTRPT
jgi:2'-5' RNA ligase/GNAT superfamily N-acetyltransferase